MRNPRFEDSALGTMREPDIKEIQCKDCVWRDKDNPSFGIVGATLGKCKVYSVKPHGILWDGDECPYYVSDEE